MTIGDLDLTNLLLILGITGVVTKTIMEQKGWTRSSKLLREENRDLIERNTTLERTLERERNEFQSTRMEQNGRIVVLESKVHELELRDQEAVLTKLDAMAADDRTRHQEAMGTWTRIAEAIERGGTA